MEARARSPTTACCCWWPWRIATLRIEVGYGLEGVLPDATARRIIDETITPLFRQRDIYGGVNAGLDRIIQVVDGEPLPPPDRQWRRPADRLVGLMPLLFFGVIVGGAVLRSPARAHRWARWPPVAQPAALVWLVSKICWARPSA